MSVTDVKPDYDLKASTDYLVVGKDAKRKKHLADGTNRLVPGFYCDAPDVASFVALGDELARRHGRKIKAQSYVLSFSPQELSVDNEADLQRVGDVAFLLAKKMHPHSPCLVVVHADGKGHAPHAHVKVINHDMVTGKALSGHRMHWQVKRANDELMREVGHDVLDVQRKYAAPEWSRHRTTTTPFEVELGDRISAARDDSLDAVTAGTVDGPGEFLETFEAGCERRGVRLEVTERTIRHGGRGGRPVGAVVTGYTFVMRDYSMPLPRWKRRKASSISEDFTETALLRSFDEARHANKAPVVFAAPAPAAVLVTEYEPLEESKGEATRHESAGIGLEDTMAPSVPSSSFRDRAESALDDASAEAEARSRRLVEEYLATKAKNSQTTRADASRVIVPKGRDAGKAVAPIISTVPVAEADVDDRVEVTSAPAVIHDTEDAISPETHDRVEAEVRSVDEVDRGETAGPVDAAAQGGGAGSSQTREAREQARRRRLAAIRAELADDPAHVEEWQDGPGWA